MESLIKAAKNGDKEAFTDLIFEIRHDLYKIARLRLSCNDDIEDAIQETIIEAYKSVKNLRDITLFKQWIIKILTNKCNRIYKKNIKYNISYENLEIDNFIVKDNKNNLESDLEFYYMLSVLNYDERIAITLFYMEDYTTKEIAKILKVNENTIKTRLRRAKIKIKKKYEGRI